MKALLWNRPDSEQQPGGDTVQWRQTAAHLQALGVEVELTLEAEPDLSGFDLVHVFNLQSDEHALPVCEQVKRAGLPLALSTIWWDLTEGRYVRRTRRKTSLFLQEKLLGRPTTYARFARADRKRSRNKSRIERAKRMLELADVLLPNSSAEIGVLEDYFELPGLSAKSAVVTNAVTFGELPAAGADAPPRAGVLMVARVYPIKNQLALIEALCGLDAPLTIVGAFGDRAYVAECRAAAARHGRCEITGPLPHAELPALYQRVAVHALPSFRETPGLVSLEAAALGCTVVSTDRGSAQEYFGEQAYYCDPADPATIRAAVEGALAEPRRVPRERLESYSWERAAKATHVAYRHLLGEALELPKALDALL